ncbi:MAG: elongation factor 4 [Candidatus Schekmanbacteria bacterium]|nr:elongation factor 4 [Candidatus Schekmanbacteria bacterium]
MTPSDQQRFIRNFSIIAHIDHGKSTLADRVLELTHAISARDAKEQYLDSMDLERERGITIKAAAVRLRYEARSGEAHVLNLIDTPGHVDFNYEVSRSLAACEGALLVVDAVQGVEAQTLANAYLAIDNNLEIVPVLNKIDLPAARPTEVMAEIEEVVGIEGRQAILCSAKTGQGVQDVLEAVISRIPAPGGDPAAPLKALIFDSWFDSFRGVVTLIRVVDGTMRTGELVEMLATGTQAEIQDLGVFTPAATPVAALSAGEVGFIITGVKDVRKTQIGDTITHVRRRCEGALAGFQQVRPVVFAGLFPIDGGAYEELRDALDRLRLNDAAFSYEPESSLALGLGFRCGFLGLLHMEIVQERLEREYSLDLITSAPTVVYRVELTSGETVDIDNPAALPEPTRLNQLLEPFVDVTIHAPSDYVGAILKLCEERRGIQKDIRYLTKNRVLVHYDMPFAEVVFDFFDKLKSCSRGYATLDYHPVGYRAGDLVRLDILVDARPVDALTLIVHRDNAYARGKDLVARLREIIPRQSYEVRIQAALGRRVIASESIRPYRKDVTAKLYGGDITRKRKLLEKQKEGKRRMKQVGKVEIPQEAFLAVFDTGGAKGKK